MPPRGQQARIDPPAPKPAEPKTKLVRAFYFTGMFECHLPEGWTPFAADAYRVYAVQE